jgi:hypothetical protein
VLARQRCAVALCAHAYRMDHPNIKDLAYLFNRHVVSQYRVLKKIISDRDKLFRRF